MPLTTDLLLRHTSDAVIAVDAAGIVVAANSRAETLLRLREDQLVGCPLVDCIPDLKGSRAEAHLADMPDGQVERRIDHFAATRYTWYEMRAIPLDGGRVLFLRDVTDRVRQARSEAVREAVRQIVMDAPVAISITRGPEHRYELVNAMSRRLVGEREMEGKTARAAFPEVDPALFDILDRVYAAGEPVTLHDLEVAFDRDGNGTLTRGTFDVTYQPLLEADGTVSGILSTSVETTAYAAERRRLAEQAASTS